MDYADLWFSSTHKDKVLKERHPCMAVSTYINRCVKPEMDGFIA